MKLKVLFRSIFFALLLQFTLTSLSLAQTFSLGSFSIGNAKVDLELNDFSIIHHNPLIQTQFLSSSLQWIRLENNLLTPRILLKITFNKKLSPIYIKLLNQVVFPHTTFDSENSSILETQLYINLYQPTPIEIYQNDQLIDSITVAAKKLANPTQKQLIDHTCTPYQVEVTGVESIYSSVGCNMIRVGGFGHETPRLEVTLASPNLETPRGDQSPFTFYLTHKSNLQTTLVDKITHAKTDIKVTAELPPRMYRLKTALGFGPYSYTSKYDNKSQGPELAGSVMLYGKLEINESSSFKFFDAALWNKSFFNNSGLYFSYDLARLHDGEVILGALLGFQGLHYQYTKESKTEFDIIYPQGFEATYNNPFGYKNKYLSLGMFASATSDIYRNIWIRAGSQVFYEVNYITWGKNQSLIEMWGLSIGIPLIKAF